MRVQKYVPEKINEEIEYPEGYSKTWFLTNPWYIPISNPKQVKPTIDFIMKYLGAERNHIDKYDYPETTRLSIFSVNGSRHSNVLRGTSFEPEPQDIRNALEVTFDEEGNPSLLIGYIGNKRDFVDNRDSNVLNNIYKLEDNINQAEEIILKLLEKRKELIKAYEGTK